VTDPAVGTRAPILVLGVGSELRRDDAVGRHVADAVARVEDPDIEVLSVHQLTPELALDLEGRERVVIVDAAVGVAEVTVSRIDPASNDQAFSHHLDPMTLLALAGRLGTAPRSLLVVSVPAYELDLGTTLSEPAGRAVAEATARVLELTVATDQR